jgi:MFS family permease
VSSSAAVNSKVPGLGLAWTLGLMAGFCSLLSAGAAVVLPTIASALDIPTIRSVWVISGFSLAYGVSMAIYGRVADLYGLRLPLIVGTLLMGAGSIMAALASSFSTLMVARVAQGIGGAAVPVLAVAIITSFRHPLLNTKGLALVTGLSSAGAGLGALIGGLLDATLGWRYSLGVPALNMALLILIWNRIPTRGTGARIDIPGALLVAATASGAILLAQSASVGASVAIIGALLCGLGIPALALWVRQNPEGFLPIALIGNKRVRQVVITATAVPIAWFSLLAAVPLALYDMQWPPVHTGLALAPSAVIGFLSARNAATLIARVGAHGTLKIATVLSGTALVTSSTGAHFGWPLVTTCGVFFVTGAFGMAQPAMVAALDMDVDQRVRGVALGTAIMTLFTSGAMGAAVIGGFTDLIGLDGAIAILLIFPVISFIIISRLMKSQSVTV